MLSSERGFCACNGCVVFTCLSSTFNWSFFFYSKLYFCVSHFSNFYSSLRTSLRLLTPSQTECCHSICWLVCHDQVFIYHSTSNPFTFISCSIFISMTYSRLVMICKVTCFFQSVMWVIIKELSYIVFF